MLQWSCGLIKKYFLSAYSGSSIVGDFFSDGGGVFCFVVCLGCVCVSQRVGGVGFPPSAITIHVFFHQKGVFRSSILEFQTSTICYQSLL